MPAPTERITYSTHAIAAIRGWRDVEQFLKNSELEQGLLELVRMRASQINGCVFCLEMHSADALANGETALRLFLLDAWEEASCYSERERAALAWTDAVTRISDGHAPDDVYNHAREQFSENELVALTVCIAQINAWNRMAISMRAQFRHTS